VSAESLVPQTIAATAEPRGRLPFAFTARFLVALLIGLLWLIPAWWSPQFVAAMFLWDAVVFVMWFGDLLRLPKPAQLEIERQWTEPLSLGRRSSTRIQVNNTTQIPLHASLVDETPLVFRDEPPSLEAPLPPGESTQHYEIHPHARGDAALGQLFLRYRTSLGLAERWAVASLAQPVRVMPDLVRARNYALYLIRSRQVEMEKRRRRQRGIGREFEALREYRQGDELRNVCWPATARRHELITRTYQVERSQAVWIILDAGRLMRAQVHDPERGLFVSKLDYAVDAALALAQVAAQSGDRVGLLAYGRGIQQSVGMGRGASHIRTMLNALAQVKAESSEADHTLAARTLLHAQSQRALIIWITDFAETATVPEVIEHATLMTRRHLVMFAAVSQPDLKALTDSVPKSEADMFRYAAAIEVAERRERLLRRLREQGVLAVDLEPGNLTDAVINQYLEVKDRGQL
jgi:uncharacterized protein (DUF58 family)